VLAESRMMIPDCRKRLEAALEDLKGILVHIFIIFVITVYSSVLLFVL
jgi:tubulin-specific chaperone A